MAKYKWKATPKAIKNIVIFLAVLLILIIIIINSISKGVKNAKARREYKVAAAELQTVRDEYAASGLSFPSGPVISAVTESLPQILTDYVYVYNNASLYDYDIRSQAKKNKGLTHFLYQMGSGDYPTVKEIEYTAAELAADIPALYQWDERWGFTEYGSSILGLNGAGPTVAAMAIVGLTGNTEVTPRSIARFAESNDLYYADYGTAWALIPEACEANGLDVYETYLDEYALQAELDEGRVVALVMTAGNFCEDSTFILLTGYNASGFTVQDPFSMENSAKTWTYEDIYQEIMAIYSIGVADEAAEE